MSKFITTADDPNGYHMKCVGAGRHEHWVIAPDDPSTEIACPDCTMRLAAYVDLSKPIFG